MVFLCAITPVFDECLPAFRLLTAALREQTCGDFIHVAISNGKSPAIQQWITDLADSRFIYEEFPHEETLTTDALFTTRKTKRLASNFSSP